MISKRVLASGTLALALFACGSGAGGDLRNEYAESCVRNLGLEKPMCKCLAQKAHENLTSNGVAFIVASMDKDVPEIQRVATRMKKKDTLAAISFMGSGPQECYEELEGS